MLEDGDGGDPGEEARWSRDPRFDGRFYVAASTTGRYCRPSCPIPRPDRRHLSWFPTAAAAQVAGFHPCLRCRPGVTPGSPEWNLRDDTVGRTMRLIRDGLVDREGPEGLARRLGRPLPELDRRLVDEVGADVAAVARAQRVEMARLLLEATDLSVARVAEAAGFTGRRSCTDTIRDVFATTPTGLRSHVARRRPRGRTDRVVQAAGTAGGGDGWHLRLRLPARRPFDGAAALDFLVGRAVPGIEGTVGTGYERTLRLPRGHGVARFVPSDSGRPGRPDPGPAFVDAELWLSDLTDLVPALSRCRQLLDLDAEPEAVVAALGADPWLGPLVAVDPGRRVPGATDGFELAVRGVVGQQVSLAGARTVAGRLVTAAGERVAPAGVDPSVVGAGVGATHLFPTPEALVALARDEPGAFSMPASRRQAIVALATAVADGSVVIDAGTDPAELRSVLTALPGIGPWTAEYVALRGLRDPDAFLPTDIGVRRAARRLGLADDSRSLARVAEAWRPWRSYAMVHLWAVAGQPVWKGTVVRS